jgi:hypothetical protein
MTTATEHAPAPDGGMSAYGCWEIDVRMFDSDMKQIDAFTCRQDLWTRTSSSSGLHVLGMAQAGNMRIEAP